MPKPKGKEQPKTGLSEEKKELLKDIKRLNSQISRKQRAALYEPLKDFLTKPIFNQILRGAFVSENNVNVATVLQTKMKELAKQNDERIKSLTN